MAESSLLTASPRRTPTRFAVQVKAAFKTDTGHFHDGTDSRSVSTSVTYGIVGAMAGEGIAASNVVGVGDAARVDHVHAINYGALGQMEAEGTAASNAIGSDDDLARINHVHALNYGAIGQMASDGTGTVNAPGSDADLARIDHVHHQATHAHTGSDNGGQLSAAAFTVAAPSDGSLAAANAEGSATSFSRSDHVHRAVLADSVEFEFGTSYNAVIGWEVGDNDNRTLVIGLADANQAIHFTDKSAIATDWNVSADTHPSIYVHSNDTPVTNYLKMWHDATDGFIQSIGGTLKLDAPTGSTVNLTINAVVEVSLSATIMDMNGNHIDNVGYIVFNAISPVSGQAQIWNEGTGELHLNALTGRTIVLEVNDSPEYSFSATALDMNANTLTMTTGQISMTSGNITISGAGYIAVEASAAESGAYRLKNTGVIAWRNTGGGGDISALTVNAVDDLEIGADIQMSDNIIYGSAAAHTGDTADGLLELRSTLNATKGWVVIPNLELGMIVGSDGSVDRDGVVGTNSIHLFNGTAPSGALVNGVSLYSDGGEFYARDATGNAILNSPHTKDGDFIIHSYSAVKDRTIRIHLEKLIGAIVRRYPELEKYVELLDGDVPNYKLASRKLPV